MVPALRFVLPQGEQAGRAAWDGDRFFAVADRALRDREAGMLASHQTARCVSHSDQ